MTDNVDRFGRYFWYIGNGGEKHGPHSERQMLSWYRDSFLSSDVRIAEGHLCDGPETFRPLAAYLKERGVANPFMPFDCVPKEGLTNGTVLLMCQMHEQTLTEISKMKKEVADFLVTGLANISLCLAKDGEVMQADLIKQMEASRKEMEEDNDKAKRNSHASFDQRSSSFDFFAGTGAVPTSVPSEWMYVLKTKMDEIADAAVSFKVDSEITLQKLDGLHHIVVRVLARLDTSAASIRIDVDGHESETLKNLFGFMRKIAHRMKIALEGESDGLPNVVSDLIKLAKWMEDMWNRLKRNSKKDDRWKKILELLTDMYAELVSLQQRLLTVFCAHFFPEASAQQPQDPPMSTSFQRRGRMDFRERSNSQGDYRRYQESVPNAPTQFRRNYNRYNNHCNNYNYNRSNSSYHCSSGDDTATSAFRQTLPPRLADHGGGFFDDV